jgi:hypothetical protein
MWVFQAPLQPLLTALSNDPSEGHPTPKAGQSFSEGSKLARSQFDSVISIKSPLKVVKHAF